MNVTPCLAGATTIGTEERQPPEPSRHIGRYPERSTAECCDGKQAYAIMIH